MRESPVASRREVTDVRACTCAALRRAARAVTQAYDAALHPIALRATQFTLLATLAARGEMPLTRLAAAMVMDRTTLTRNLRPLAADGLVALRPGQDRRVRLVGLTEAGREAYAAALPHWQAAQEQLVGRLGEPRWSGLLDDLAAAVAATE